VLHAGQRASEGAARERLGFFLAMKAMVGSCQVQTMQCREGGLVTLSGERRGASCRIACGLCDASPPHTPATARHPPPPCRRPSHRDSTGRVPMLMREACGRKNVQGLERG